VYYVMMNFIVVVVERAAGQDSMQTKNHLKVTYVIRCIYYICCCPAKIDKSTVNPSTKLWKKHHLCILSALVQ
jgi:hypothetical protein